MTLLLGCLLCVQAAALLQMSTSLTAIGLALMTPCLLGASALVSVTGQVNPPGRGAACEKTRVVCCCSTTCCMLL